jgi:hypothetical protein
MATKGRVPKQGMTGSFKRTLNQLLLLLLPQNSNNMTFLHLPYVPLHTHINMVPSILRARKVNLAISKPISPPETVRFLSEESPHKGERLSGGNLIPSDGYSSLVCLSF